MIAAGATGMLAAVLAGCGSSGTKPTAVAPSATAPAATTTAPTATFNATDAAFTRDALVLADQSTAPAGLVAGHTDRSQVRTMAGHMDGHSRDAADLRGWMHDHGQPVPPRPALAAPRCQGRAWG